MPSKKQSTTPTTTKTSLPKGWEWVRFGGVVRNVNATCTNPTEHGLERFVGLEHLEPRDLRIRTWGNIKDGTTFTRLFRAGQVLFGKRRAYQRKAAIANFDGLCSGDIYVFAANASILIPELLPFLVQTEGFANHAENTSEGSLSPRTKWKYLADYEFALPTDMSEQRRIAELLQAADSAVEAWRETVDQLERTRSATLKALYPFGIFGGSQSKKAIQHQIGNCARITTGGTPDRSKPEYWNGDIPWIKTGEVDYCDIVCAEESITEDGVNSSSAKLIPSGSILMALYGQGPTLGRVARLKINAAINQACAAIIPNQNLDPDYLYYYLTREYLHIRSLARGATQPNINAGIVKELFIPVPRLSEQQDVVKKIQSIEIIQSKTKSQQSRSHELYFQLLSHLLTPPEAH